MGFVDDDEVVVGEQDLLPVRQGLLVRQLTVVPDEVMLTRCRIAVDRPAVGADDLPGVDPAVQLRGVEVRELPGQELGDRRPRTIVRDTLPGRADAVPEGQRRGGAGQLLIPTARPTRASFETASSR